jgi:hypothetical protein
MNLIIAGEVPGVLWASSGDANTFTVEEVHAWTSIEQCKHIGNSSNL